MRFILRGRRSIDGSYVSRINHECVVQTSTGTGVVLCSTE